MATANELRVSLAGTEPVITTVQVEIVPPTQTELLQHNATERYRRETGGTVVGGMPVATDDRSKMMIMGARLAAPAGPDLTTQWKNIDGSFATINAATIIAVSGAVSAHVAALFAAEATIAADISAEIITTYEQLNAAWELAS
jgi:hypothetical protein